MADPAPSPQTEPAPPASPSLLAHLDTEHLVKIRREMSLIPGDATTLAHIVAFIRSVISRELNDPARVERDKAAQEAQAAQARQRAADDLAARQAAEKAAIAQNASVDPAAQQEAAQKALDEKHAAEAAALEHEHEAADLAARQAEERAAFDKHQADARAELAAKHAPPAPEPPPAAA